MNFCAQKILPVFCLFIIVLFTEDAFSQCACVNGASVGGLTPLGGSSNPGVLKEGITRASVFYKHGYGDQYYSGSSKTGQGVVKNYLYNYLGLNAAYGITDDLTLEMESGYFIGKKQEFEYYDLSSSGFSHLAASLKYNLYNSRAKEIEFTAGIGGRAPLNFKDVNVPQNVLPSTVSIGMILHSFLHKGFKNAGYHLFLVNRAEFNTENRLDYRYGNSLFSSLFLTKTLSGNFTALLEARNEYRAKDQYSGHTVEDSGGLIFVASPQISFKTGEFYASVNLDYPFYKNYYGKQLANSYSFGLGLTWQSDLLK